MHTPMPYECIMRMCYKLIMKLVAHAVTDVTSGCGCRCCCFCFQIAVALRKKNVLIYTVTEDKMILKKEISTTEPAVAMVR